MGGAFGTLPLMLSSRTKYGIHALIHMAQRHGTGFIAIREISETERIPHKFLESILLDLKGDGILTSRAGPSGGYALRVPPESVSLGDVVRLLEGPLALAPCVSQRNYAPCLDCRDERECSLRIFLEQVRESTARILDHVTLGALAREELRLKDKGGPHSFDI